MARQCRPESPFHSPRSLCLLVGAQEHCNVLSWWSVLPHTSLSRRTTVTTDSTHRPGELDGKKNRQTCWGGAGTCMYISCTITSHHHWEHEVKFLSVYSKSSVSTLRPTSNVCIWTLLGGGCNCKIWVFRVILVSLRWIIVYLRQRPSLL